MHLPFQPSIRSLILLSVFLRTVLSAQSSTNATLASPVAIPLVGLATSFPDALKPQSPSQVAATQQIRNTLALYPFAIDGKNFPALSNVFAEDAVANYSEPLGVLTGLPNIQSVLQQSLAKVNSQHTYGTQIIDVDASCNSARSISYYTANQFGLPPQNEGKVVYSYGQYQDFWQKQSHNGEWRIKTRSLVYMGPTLGDLSIFT